MVFTTPTAAYSAATKYFGGISQYHCMFVDSGFPESSLSTWDVSCTARLYKVVLSDLIALSFVIMAATDAEAISPLDNVRAMLQVGF